MDIRRTAEIIKSLADTSRLRIVSALAREAQCVEELASRLGLAASTVSFHLKKLELAGMVYGEKVQYYAVYRLNAEMFSLTLADLLRAEDSDAYAQEERLARYRAKVIRAFFKKGRLAQLPAQHKKRLVVLNEFLAKFKHGKEYPEKSVDEIINTMYHDHCTIRRLLVEEGFMRRKNQMYTRTEKKEHESADKKGN